MTRRTLLEGTLPVLAAVAGCAGSGGDGTAGRDCPDGWSPSIEAGEPTLAPGEEATVHVAATGVAGVNFRDVGVPAPTSWMEFENASVVPGPAYGSDGFPPGYGWDEPVDVEIAVPVAVPPDADRGEYSFAVRATPDCEDPPSVERNVTITVAGD